MGEKKGFIFVFIILCTVILPFALDWFIFNVKTDQFTKAATEMNQLVQEAGNYTPTVANVVQKYKANDLDVTISVPKVGAETPLPVGSRITITYHYERQGFFGIKHTLHTSNEVIVKRR